MNAATQARLRRRHEGIEAGLDTLHRLRDADAEGMTSGQIAELMGAPPGQTGIGRRMLHVERAATIGGANWEGARRQSMRQPARWHAGPEIDAVISAVERYREAIGRRDVIALNDDPVPAGRRQYLRLDAFETIRDPEMKQTDTFEALTAMLEDRDISVWTDNARTADIHGVHAVPYRTHEHTLPDESTGVGAWSGLRELEKECAEAATRWTEMHTASAWLAATRRVFRILPRIDPVSQVLRARAQLECGDITGWRPVFNNEWTTHFDSMFASHSEDARDGWAHGGPPPRLSSAAFWRVAATGPGGVERERIACLLGEEVATPAQLIAVGALEHDETLLGCTAMHSDASARDGIRTAKVEETDAIAVHTLAELAFREGAHNGAHPLKEHSIRHASMQRLSQARRAVGELIELSMGAATTAQCIWAAERAIRRWRPNSGESAQNDARDSSREQSMNAMRNDLMLQALGGLDVHRELLVESDREDECRGQVREPVPSRFGETAPATREAARRRRAVEALMDDARECSMLAIDEGQPAGMRLRQRRTFWWVSFDDTPEGRSASAAHIETLAERNIATPASRTQYAQATSALTAEDGAYLPLTPVFPHWNSLWRSARAQSLFDAHRAVHEHGCHASVVVRMFERRTGAGALIHRLYVAAHGADYVARIASGRGIRYALQGSGACADIADLSDALTYIRTRVGGGEAVPVTPAQAALLALPYDRIDPPPQRSVKAVPAQQRTGESE